MYNLLVSVFLKYCGGCSNTQLFRLSFPAVLLLLLSCILVFLTLYIHEMRFSLSFFRSLIPLLLLFSSSSSSANDFANSFMASCNRGAMKDGNSSIVSNFYCNCALDYVVRANSLANNVVQNAQKYCIARTQAQFQQKASTNIYDFLIEYERQSGATVRCMLTGNCNN